MKIGQTTRKILKNFSTINTSIQFRKGDVLTTISPENNIVGRAKLEESFPRDFAVYRLNEFLGVADILNCADPEFDFHDKFCVITPPENVNRKFNFIYSDPSVVKSFDKNINIPQNPVEVDIDQQELSSLIRAAGSCDLKDLTIQGKKGNVVLRVHNNKDTSAHDFQITKESASVKTFEATIKVENLKMLEGNYQLRIAADTDGSALAHFINKDVPVQYWIGVEDGSKGLR